MLKHRKPDIQVLTALTTAIAATDGLPDLQEDLITFAASYQQGKISGLGIGLFSRRISRAVYLNDYQVPEAVLALLSLLNQRHLDANPGWS